MYRMRYISHVPGTAGRFSLAPCNTLGLMPGARPHSSNLPRSALSATRHCSAKPLKHRAALQLLRTTVAVSATVTGSIAAPAVTLRGRGHDMAKRKKNTAPR